MAFARLSLLALFANVHTVLNAGEGYECEAQSAPPVAEPDIAIGVSANSRRVEDCKAGCLLQVHTGDAVPLDRATVFEDDEEDEDLTRPKPNRASTKKATGAAAARRHRTRSR